MKSIQAIIVILIPIITTITTTDARISSSRNPTRRLQRRLIDTITFDDPTHHGKLLDYCLRFGSECGKPAADAYCAQRGYDEAISFPKRRAYDRETLSLEQLSTCSPAHNVCDTFDYVTCLVTEQTYKSPMEHGRSLDSCFKFESECGASAADAFCEDRGYARAKEYALIVATEGETMTIGNHAVCDPRWHGCNTFTYITCVTSVVGSN
mmetsp:Transcript_27273/g.56864  ORF Transcript_27273/g.56864 Transcript_27273/m.56864 type:complete len:209 (-) Transcript_27273:49-675(-)